ncbi:hypothetical protein [Piscirickettsia litoralis]|uniref:Pentapeptide repeat-containing protein n=1 Tax=Piscirickettsia litoralis TaxID=1891921 RepID=A0ABX3A0C7_9GAMM|nr:hypothetical protein [Piscirickettsia litoralis]ODN40915.1 hypothetical protein BGC07_19120 [Piscirickettsia litoralis]
MKLSDEQKNEAKEFVEFLGNKYNWPDSWRSFKDLISRPSDAQNALFFLKKMDLLNEKNVEHIRDKPKLVELINYIIEVDGDKLDNSDLKGKVKKFINSIIDKNDAEIGATFGKFRPESEALDKQNPESKTVNTNQRLNWGNSREIIVEKLNKFSEFKDLKSENITFPDPNSSENCSVKVNESLKFDLNPSGIKLKTSNFNADVARKNFGNSTCRVA